MRVVYDASARSGGPSLNDCLHTGPKFNQRILEILLRFRSYPVAFIADIEKAFLMISVNPKDRDVLRFLWVKDPFSKDPETVVLRFTRVIFGMSASPFLLNATIKHHIDGYAARQPEVVRLLEQSIYVDDVVCGADREQEALTLYVSAKQILSHGSFNLRKFVTNSPSLQSLVDSKEPPAKDTKPHADVVEADETYLEATCPPSLNRNHTEHKVLGIRWNVSLDQLTFSLDAMLEVTTTVKPTKRVVISLIGRVYDPLGFLAPVTVRLKILMQELCKNKLGWDQPLDGELLAKWTKLVEQLKGALPITLPRCCLLTPRSESKTYRLNGFCDASTAAYAAVVYLVEEDEDSTYSHFVVSKTRVSPLKHITIPRLELLSALCLARLISNVTGSLNERLSLEIPRCFTDSQVALFWKMAKVQRLITGRDGQTRGALLKVATKGKGLATLQRPVQLIYPLGVAQLEAQGDSEPVVDTEERTHEEEGDEPNSPGRLQRDSALRARNRVKTWTSELMEEDEHG